MKCDKSREVYPIAIPESYDQLASNPVRKMFCNGNAWDIRL